MSLSGTLPVNSVPLVQSHYAQELKRRRLYSGVALLIFVLLMVSGFIIADDRNAGGFWDGLSQLDDYPSEVLAEAWAKKAELPGLFAQFVPALIETINIAAAATIIGAIFGFLFSLLSTRGLAPWPRLIPVFRRTMDIMRAIPEIVIALVLIFVLGGGPVPAMIAIAIHTTGALGKMFSEVSENADLKPVEGLSSTGANWSQRMWLGVLPQVAPNLVSYSLLRLEINVRASAILGFVGAGGIGYELRNAMAWGPGRFDDAVVIFILLFVTIVVIDQLSSLYRLKMVEGQQ